MGGTLAECGAPRLGGFSADVRRDLREIPAPQTTIPATSQCTFAPQNVRPNRPLQMLPKAEPRNGAADAALTLSPAKNGFYERLTARAQHGFDPRA